ncbi:hypothetical protein BC833DRAFT_570399, partial [Globomyces pollinis-pini]
MSCLLVDTLFMMTRILIIMINVAKCPALLWARSLEPINYSLILIKTLMHSKILNNLISKDDIQVNYSNSLFGYLKGYEPKMEQEMVKEYAYMAQGEEETRNKFKKLNSENYGTWKVYMQLLLEKRGLFKYIQTEEFSKDDGDNSE